MMCMHHAVYSIYYDTTQYRQIHRVYGTGMDDSGILWGFPQVFSVGMGWVWGLKFNPHGSPAVYNIL